MAALEGGGLRSAGGLCERGTFCYPTYLPNKPQLLAAQTSTLCAFIFDCNIGGEVRLEGQGRKPRKLFPSFHKGECDVRSGNTTGQGGRGCYSGQKREKQDFGNSILLSCPGSAGSRVSLGAGGTTLRPSSPCNYTQQAAARRLTMSWLRVVGVQSLWIMCMWVGIKAQGYLYRAKS